MSYETTVTRPVLKVFQSEAAPAIPRLSTQLIATADGELNRELMALLVEAPPEIKSLTGKRIAVLSTNGVEELELTVPLRWLRERGATVDLVSPRIDTSPSPSGVQMPEIVRTHVLTIRFLENAGWVPIDRYLGEVKSSEYDAVMVPGGAWNPDTLRLDPNAQAFVAETLRAGKPLFAICHGPQVLISADVLRGRTVTGFWSIQVDLKNAGATVVEAPCVVDGNLITGRFPFDLPRCLPAFERQIAGAASVAPQATAAE